MTDLELLLCARRRGITFRLVGPGCVAMTGDEMTMAVLKPQLEAREPEIVALIEEFSHSSAPVAAAEAILAGAYAPFRDHATRHVVGERQANGNLGSSEGVRREFSA